MCKFRRQKKLFLIFNFEESHIALQKVLQHWPQIVKKLTVGQCDQIWWFIGLWHQLICPNLTHFYSIFVKVSKSIIFQVKSFWATFMDIWRFFLVTLLAECFGIPLSVRIDRSIDASVDSSSTWILRSANTNTWDFFQFSNFKFYYLLPSLKLNFDRLCLSLCKSLSLLIYLFLYLSLSFSLFLSLSFILYIISISLSLSLTISLSLTHVTHKYWHLIPSNCYELITD